MNSALIRTLPLILLSSLLAAISGCATTPVPPEMPPLEQIDQLTAHQRQLDTLKSWQLKGRLAISYNGESWNASINWQKSPEHYDIQLYLPLGQGSMQLRGDSGGATLKTSEGEHYMAESSETLFYQQFGLIFPVTALQEWVIGRPASATEGSSDWLQQVNENGEMVRLEQDHWNLRLLGYQTVSKESPNSNPDDPNFPKALSLPRKIFMSQNGNSVRLVVQQWQLHD